MNRLARTALIAVVLQAVLLIDISVRSDSSSACTSGYDCYLYNVFIQTEEEAAKFKLPMANQISFLKPNILTGKLLFRRLPDVVKYLEIYKGTLPEFYIKSTLYEFKTYLNGLREVIINETDTYKLRSLKISYCKLRSVPENVNKLINLKTLNLYANEIETVNMDNFKDMTQLQYLCLSNNSITRVDTKGALNLPRLEQIYFDTNKLANLSMTLWNFPKLSAIRLYNNTLRTIRSFPSNFTILKEVYLINNEWSCAWLETINFSPETKTTAGFIKSESCSGKSVHDICCQDYSVDEKSFYNLEESIDVQILLINANLQKTIVQMEDKISKMTAETKELIDYKISEQGRTIKKINAELNARVDDVQQINLNLQKMIEQTNEKISKLTANTKELVENKLTDVTQTVQRFKEEVNEKVIETRELIIYGRKQTNADLKRAVADIDEKISNMATVTKLQIDKSLNDVNRTIQGIEEEVKTMNSSARKQAQELQEINTKVAKNQASSADDRNLLEEKIRKNENQIKDELKLVKQKVNENRALINDIVEDLYLEELEKQEL